ncbi:hypothetical protein N7532_004323 [Penicillium argentinense]|uniref:Uncharacterized protein n=1 Tax=Penicillium argentinense TaxID=1131581 RepID=A0A9W9FP63_9EURO|nr:uncharacterized protein N7532_004323 [Penicillium argentinense]KAJ5103794.1 hypothetical protein N7532_004323 [Penicillium argentinense]
MDVADICQIKLGSFTLSPQVPGLSIAAWAANGRRACQNHVTTPGMTPRAFTSLLAACIGALWARVIVDAGREAYGGGSLDGRAEWTITRINANDTR